MSDPLDLKPIKAKLAVATDGSPKDRDPWIDYLAPEVKALLGEVVRLRVEVATLKHEQRMDLALAKTGWGVGLHPIYGRDGNRPVRREDLGDGYSALYFADEPDGSIPAAVYREREPGVFYCYWRRGRGCERYDGVDVRP